MRTYSSQAELLRDFEDAKTWMVSSVAKIAEELRDPEKTDTSFVKAEKRKISRAVQQLIGASIRIVQSRTSQADLQASRSPELGLSRAQNTTAVLEMQKLLFKWRKLNSRIDDQIEFKPVRLYPKPSAVASIQERQRVFSNRAYRVLHNILKPDTQDEAAEQSGAYPDIGLANSAFVEHMHAAFRVTLAQRLPRQPRFLDVGCGIGLKVLTAHQFFPRTDGLELDPGYAKTARKLLKKSAFSNAKIFQTDALEFQKYDAYDVIYFYWPIHDEKKMIELEKRIIAMAQPGTILIAPYPGFGSRYPEYECQHIAGNLYLAKTSKRQASRVRRRAERFGLNVPVKSSSSETIWSPIESVLAANGFVGSVEEGGR